MSYNAGMSATVTTSPMNLTNKLEMPAMPSIKTEEEDISNGCGGGSTAIKRHTIDAILGLPRLGGFGLDSPLDQRGLIEGAARDRSTYSESENEASRDKEKFMNEGEF